MQYKFFINQMIHFKSENLRKFVQISKNAYRCKLGISLKLYKFANYFRLTFSCIL